jgi:hypothetical protein
MTIQKNIDALEIQLLIAKCLSNQDEQGAQVLSELAERNGISLDRKWIEKRVMHETRISAFRMFGL